MTARRLAAILAADVVGFSRLISADEAATRARMPRASLPQRWRCPASGTKRGP